MRTYKKTYKTLLVLSGLLLAPPAISDTVITPGQWSSAQIKAALIRDPVLVLADSDYPGGVKLNLAGTAKRPLTIKAQNAGKAIIRGGTQDGLTLNGTHYLTVSGLSFTGAARAGLFVSSSRHVTLDGVDCSYNGVWGALTGRCDGLRVVRSTFSRNTEQHGLYVSGNSTGVYVGDCTFENNGRCGLQLNGLGAGDSRIVDALIEGNRLSGNGVGGGSALNLLTTGKVRVSRNTLEHNLAGGIACYNSFDVAISGNSVSFDPGQGFHCVSARLGSKNITLTDNSFTMGKPGQRNWPTSWAYEVGGGSVITDGGGNSLVISNPLYSGRN